jgi:hypothetical protein
MSTVGAGCAAQGGLREQRGDEGFGRFGTRQAVGIECGNFVLRVQTGYEGGNGKTLLQCDFARLRRFEQRPITRLSLLARHGLAVPDHHQP